MKPREKVGLISTIITAIAALIGSIATLILAIKS